MAEALVFMAEKYNSANPEKISFTITRDDLSALSGITPESVSRNLTDFRIEKLIEIENGEIAILNLKKLKDMKN